MKKLINNEGIPFKDFLNQSTNLITIFGVFNALFIYSTSVADKEISSFLLIPFFILSLLVWFELISFAFNSNDGSKKYELFYFLSCSIQIGLIWFFISEFKLFLSMIGVYGLLMAYVFLIILFFVWVFKKILRRLSDKKFKYVWFILVISSILLAGLLMELSTPIIKSVLEKVIPITN